MSGSAPIPAPDLLLRAMFDAAVAAAMPSSFLPGHLPEPPRGRTVVVGAGKAAAAMAAVVEEHWPGPLSGLVVTRYGHAVPTARITVVEAGHPVPDAAGRKAARDVLDLARGLGPEDLLLCLISGGGSALLTLPAPGLSLADKQHLNRALLRSGATIAEINCARKHLSAIKGGRLAAAAAPARVVALLLSDVPGDDPSVIASGPTVADPTTRADALAVLVRHGIEVPPSVRAHLETPAAETPKPGDPCFAQAEAFVAATAQRSLDAAAAVARAAGVTPVVLGGFMEGEASQVALVHAAIARQAFRHGQPAAPPCVLISGGETTVTVRGSGLGGRNTEFLLALAVALNGHPGIHALAADTDGIDGSEDNAGAILRPDSLSRAMRAGRDAVVDLAANDSHGFFAALGDLVVTGPTRTNVNDFRAVLVLPDGPAAGP
ncbi:MAG: glycerate kinase [Alphaproteobacteria bacterium]